MCAWCSVTGRREITSSVLYGFITRPHSDLKGLSTLNLPHNSKEPLSVLAVSSTLNGGELHIMVAK